MENYWFGRFWKGFLFVFDVYEISDSENADLWNDPVRAGANSEDDSFASLLCWCVDCLMIESSPHAKFHQLRSQCRASGWRVHKFSGWLGD